MTKPKKTSSESPFQVVLIDIEQAADEKIVCVEKPLEETHLEFIALSYRWGEVREQVIDTNLGYMASVTSFALDDFCTLCRDITNEPDLQSIKYVWVDAICVDQNNHARRKATIYQMSNIYHRAAYILAVPDLHLTYLRNNQILYEELDMNVGKCKEFIYYALHARLDQLEQITEKWFDEMNIPKDTMARESLTIWYGDHCFTDHLEQDADKYKHLVHDRAKTVTKVMKYLEYLIKDWSSRVWVISEVNIAKTKPSRKMKYWFLSLGIDWDNVEKLNFFVFDFNYTNADDLYPDYEVVNHILSKANLGYHNFQETILSQLNERSFVEMMLESKASRNEDRFYAIFPSTEYKTILTSREVVSSWQIDTIASVKLKLFELMTTKDKLDLLYRTALGYSKPYCTFPAFVHMDVDMNNDTIIPIKERANSRPCNFDLNNNATLRLVPPMDNENGFHFHKLNLSPKTYYVVRPDENCYGKEKIFDNNQRFWETLEINDVDDDLVYVRIPQYIQHISDSLYRPKEIVLFGNFKKNKWLLCETPIAKNVIEELAVKDYDNSDGNISFDIY